MNSLQKACSPHCAIVLVTQQREKAYKKKTLELKRNFRAKDKSYWKQKAAKECHAYIRLRDRDLPCISCQRHTSGQYHAGHYKSRGSSPSHQFCEWNIAKQCAHCNTYKSGNQAEFRRHLINRIGLELVEYLDCYHPPYKWTIDDYKAVFDHYREKRQWLDARIREGKAENAGFSDDLAEAIPKQG